jgi:hypothetical protein
MFPLEISDDEEDFSLSDDEDHFSSDAGYESEEVDESMDQSGTQGDISGILAGTQSEILVTQPALDDVDEHFFPCDEDRDEDHLDSHTLGSVYASSGIKRWNRKGVLHEIDWALLKLDEGRMQPCNLIQGGRRYCRTAPEKKQTLTSRLVEPVCRGGAFSANDDEFPNEIAKSDNLSNLPVHCLGRTSGLQAGVIGPAMSSVRIYKRRSFSRSWYVMGDFGGMILTMTLLLLYIHTNLLPLQLAATLAPGSSTTMKVASAATCSRGARAIPSRTSVPQTCSSKT